MYANKQSGRIHPLMAGAAASVMLVSLVATAAIVGIIPNSHGSSGDATRLAPQPVMAAAPNEQGAAAPVAVREVVEHRTVVHHQYVQHRARPVQVAQAEPVRPAYQQPAPAAQNSPVGIGVGAVVGGLLGSQVGGGNGKTLATIAGAVGGGYVGNEIAKRSQ